MKNYLREDLIGLKPYDAEGKPYVHKMDANEGPWDLPQGVREALAKDLIEGSHFNRYPDSNATNLREAIGKYCGVSPDQIIVGAGSDELIQVLITGSVNKGDRVIYPTPSFGMYRIFTLIAGGIPIEVPLGQEYEYNIDGFYGAISKHNPKLIFICSPNNPTGNTIDPKGLKNLIRDFSGIVAVDEAYGEFTNETVLKWIEEFPNLVVLRTFSKAFGLAGLRIGYCVCSPELAYQINRVKPPYNINSFSQNAAILALENINIVKKRIEIIIEQRKLMYHALKEMNGIKVYPSEANFLLIQVPHGNSVWQELLDRGILVRDFSDYPYLEGCLRVTVADEHANRDFIHAMMQILAPYKERGCRYSESRNC